MVYFSNFFRFFGKAEEDFYEHLGLLECFGAKDLILPRVEAYCQYKKPARFNDILEIELTIEDLKEKSVKYSFKIYNKKTAELVAEGYVVAVAVDRRTLKAVQIPEEIAEKLKPFCNLDRAK